MSGNLNREKLTFVMKWEKKSLFLLEFMTDVHYVVSILSKIQIYIEIRYVKVR